MEATKSAIYLYLAIYVCSSLLLVPYVLVVIQRSTPYILSIKVVYSVTWSLVVAERKTSLGKDWHRQCLTCQACNKVLNPGQHSEVANHYLSYRRCSV